MEKVESKPAWYQRTLTLIRLPIRWEVILGAAILLLAIFSRFYILDARVMSHDEVNHVTPSYRLYNEGQYQHDPVTHGPLQFHLIALSYFLFHDNDLTSRLPSALLSIGTVLFILLKYRPYLGKAGRFIAAFMVVISPYMLFYGRYTRNESYIGLFGVMLFYGIFKYLDTGKTKYLYLVTLANILHITSKETSFIYIAQSLLFFALLLLDRITRQSWPRREYRRYFIIALVVGILFLGLGAYLHLRPGSAAVAPDAIPGAEYPAPTAEPAGGFDYAYIIIGLGGIEVAAAVYFLFKGFGLPRLRVERSFDLAMLTGTLILPMLSAFFINALGWNSLDYSSTGITHSAIVLIPVFVISVVLGILWRWEVWVGCAILFYSIFTVFYTTFFTNGQGFFTGMIGSLGYWLSQQGVNRGSQPWYFYAFLQVPFYEFLPALAALLGVYFTIRGYFSQLFAHPQPEVAEIDLPVEGLETTLEPLPEPAALETVDAVEAVEEPPPPQKAPFTFFMIFWSLTSLIAYTLAGEKMPWLTVHITYPLILLGAWALNRLVLAFDWSLLKRARGWLTIPLLPVFIFALLEVIWLPLGITPPFKGKQTSELVATYRYLGEWLILIGSGAALYSVTRGWTFSAFRKLGGMFIFLLLAGITARSAYLANYVNYDTGKEFLVYAHAARGPKDILAQIESISRRMNNSNGIEIAYDNEMLYPYWWYLRSFPNTRYFADTPSRDIRDVPIVVAGDNNFGKVDPILGKNYYKFETLRMVWPMQDYFNMTWERIRNALVDPMIRSGLLQIWLNRDYTQYAEATGSTQLTLESWSPGDRMRIYIRKDIAAQLWDYAVGPAEVEEITADPYEGATTAPIPQVVIGATGSEPAQFQAPRAVAVAADNTLYVADSRNHRIQHLRPDGSVLQVWGSFADLQAGDAPGGTFNEPWGVSVGPDGSVYVADTWNHRIQKFTADGQFLKMWGQLGQDGEPYSFWGPRGVLATADGKVYVVDTGNKRVVVYDSDGNYIAEFGGPGLEPGQMDEPVGLTADANGNLILLDTWNQRIQLFAPTESNFYSPYQEWPVDAWYSNAAEHKPYIAIDSDGLVYLADPEKFRVLVFTENGTFVKAIGGLTMETSPLGMPIGLAVDAENGLWITDAGYNRLLRYQLPLP